MGTYGTVTDYATGDAIRPATAEEWRKTADVMAARESDSYTGAWNDSDGIAVFVDGGPDAEVSREDIRQLRDEAGTAGDLKQVALCDEALGDSDDPSTDADRAWYACAQVILDTRMETAASA